MNSTNSTNSTNSINNSSNKTITFIYNIWILARPKQWIKNGIVLAALLFSKNIFNLSKLLITLEGLILFSLVSSLVYMINDIFDIEKDKLHPIKRHRPLASGKVQVKQVIIIVIVLLITILPIALYINLYFGGILFLYFIMNLAYSFYLKHIVIIDAMIIAIGFVLRAIAGAVIINVAISHWLLLCTILLALFLAFCKRRYELMKLENNATEHRKILKEYSHYFLDQLIGVVTASTVMSYILYTMSEETIEKFNTSNLFLTIPFVLYGVFRYLYLVHQKIQGGSPARVLLTDKPLLINIILWALTVVIIIYY